MSKRDAKTKLRALRYIRIMMCFILAAVILIIAIYGTFFTSPSGRFAIMETEDTKPVMIMANAMIALAVTIVLITVITLWVVERMLARDVRQYS
ncbi:MAG: hypothetical protein ABIA21_02250 [Candidatus Aenigmatarchaeota archaeon]